MNIPHPLDNVKDDGVKRIPIDQFRREGWLLEVNRQFFHPHGLALEVEIDDDGVERFGGVWDYREDPEGITYGPLGEDAEQRAKTIYEERLKHFEERSKLFGTLSDQQPFDWTPES